LFKLLFICVIII